MSWCAVAFRLIEIYVSAGASSAAPGSSPAAVADYAVVRPKQPVGIGKQGLARLIREARAIEQSHHGLPQRLRARELRIGRLPSEQIGDELAGGLRMHRPIGDEERARPGIEERAAESRGGLRTGARAGGGVACGQHHPVRIELEGEDIL